MILKSYRFNYNVELSFVVLSVAYALIGKIVWNSIAKDSSEKFFDIKFFIVGIIPAIFLIGFGLI
jgi:F0F1-type ATP synthase membrane subunit c/vacuolar-type H+-ATPase subunit K